MNKGDLAQGGILTTEELINSTPDPENPNSRTPNLSSPNSTPKTRLNIENDEAGAGWATDNDPRPKPVRPRFGDLKHIECQVASQTIAKLGVWKSDELDLGEIPKVTSEVDQTRSIANRIISRPGKLFLILSEILKKDMISKMIKKDLIDRFVISDLTSYFGENNLASLIPLQVPEISKFFTQAAEGAASKDPALRDALYTASTSLATTFLTKVALFLTEDTHNGHFNDFCKKLAQIEGHKLQNVILEGHINNMNFVPTIILALEDLPSGSPINSLQTVNDNVTTLTKSTKELTFRVAKGEVMLNNTMTMVSDIKSEEVATRHSANEQKVRIHNVTSITDFKEKAFRDKVDLVSAICSKIAGHNNFEMELITPRPGGRFFESLAIVTFRTPGHKYKFEKSFSDFKKSNPSCKLTSSRPKMEQNKSDNFQTEEAMRNRIKVQYDLKLASTDNPHCDHAPLTEQQVKGIQINLKQLSGPNRSYFEFMDPSNGTYFMVYDSAINPFADHDFTKPIANKFVRKLADSNKEYFLKFKPKVWKNSTR